VECHILAQGDVAFKHLLAKPLIFNLSELPHQLLDLRSNFLLRSEGGSDECIKFAQLEKPADAANST